MAATNGEGDVRKLVGSCIAGVAGLAAVWLWARQATRLGDRATDIVARRPSTRLGRALYRDPRGHHPSFRVVLERLALGPEDRLVELGCGGGAFLLRALATGCSAHAIDHSPDMVALARQQNRAACAQGRLEVIEADAARLPFADGEFTAATTMNAFFFFADPAAVLREAHRVLGPDGRLVIVTHPPDLPGWLSRSFLGRRMRGYPDDRLRQMCHEAGFTDVSVERVGLGGGVREHGIMQVATARRTRF